MIHAIKNYDKKVNGSHSTLCGKRIGVNDGHSFDPEKITCPRCKKMLLEIMEESDRKSNDILQEALKLANQQ